MSLRERWGQHRDRLVLYGGLALWGLIGAAFIVLSTYLPHGIISEITRDIGIAFLSAAVLGLTVHIWIESTVVRDVFRAAIGHVLPEELRDEVHWISSFKCIVSRCVCDLRIEDIGDGIVKVTEELDTEMRNITTKSQLVKRLFTKDDWGIPGKHTEILQYEYTIEGEAPVSFSGTPKIFPDRSVQINMPDVLLPAGKTMRTFSRGVEFRRANDRFFEEWIYPVVRLELHIRYISDSLVYFSEFSHDPPILVIQNGRRHILEGTLMPHQKMGVRWFPKEESAISAAA